MKLMQHWKTRRQVAVRKSSTVDRRSPRIYNAGSLGLRIAAQTSSYLSITCYVTETIDDSTVNLSFHQLTKSAAEGLTSNTCFFTMTITLIFRLVCISLLILMAKASASNHHSYERALSTTLDTRGMNSLKSYFANRHCIRYNHAPQLLRFDELPGRVDSSGRLRLVVSLDSLSPLPNRDPRTAIQGFSFYFLMVSRLSCE